MRVIVDANIVFSAILNTNGKIGDILINGGKRFEFVAPNFLRYEIKSHYTKLIKISGLTIDEIQESEFQIYKSENTMHTRVLELALFHSLPEAQFAQ